MVKLFLDLPMPQTDLLGKLDLLLMKLITVLGLFMMKLLKDLGLKFLNLTQNLSQSILLHY